MKSQLRATTAGVQILMDVIGFPSKQRTDCTEWWNSGYHSAFIMIAVEAI
jgi:hypothetical protein